jgi:hypothetical protein
VLRRAIVGLSCLLSERGSALLGSPSEGEELVDVVQDWGCWISSFLRKVSSGFCPRTYSVGPKLRDSVFS